MHVRENSFALFAIRSHAVFIVCQSREIRGRVPLV